MKKILVVDDNQDLHSVMRKLLTFMGYESISAASAKEGLEKAVSERPDIILLDSAECTGESGQGDQVGEYNG